MVALFQRLDPLAHLDDNACALVAKDSREQAFRVLAGTGELVSVADAGRFDLDQAFAFLRALQGDGFDGKWLARLIGDGGACFHDDLPVWRFFVLSAYTGWSPMPVVRSM